MDLTALVVVIPPLAGAALAWWYGGYCAANNYPTVHKYAFAWAVFCGFLSVFAQAALLETCIKHAFCSDRGEGNLGFSLTSILAVPIYWPIVWWAWRRRNAAV